MSGRWSLLFLLALLAITTLASAKPWERSEEQDEEEEGTFSRMYRRYIDPSNPDSVLGRVGRFFSGVYNFFKRRFGSGDDEPEAPPAPPKREPYPERDSDFPPMSITFPPRTRVPNRPSSTSTTTPAPSSQKASETPATQEPSSYPPDQTTMKDVPDYYSSEAPKESDTIPPGSLTTDNIPQSSSGSPDEIAPSSEPTTPGREADLSTPIPEVEIDQERPIIHSLEEEDDYNNAIPDDSTFYTRVRDKKR